MFKKFREELREEIKNTKKDLEKEVSKVWQIDYKGHAIQIVNSANEEILYINNEVVDQKSRDNMSKQILPYIKLKGDIIETDGTVSKVHVKMGGFLTLNIVVKVNDTILIKEKHKISI
ncbi:MAG: hypothetical protein RR642_12995 [Solibacillus sp.]